MADSSSTVTTILRYEIDQPASNKARAGVQSISKETASLSSQMQKLSIEADQAARELADIQQQIGSGQHQGTAYFQILTHRAEMLESQLSEVNAELDKLEVPRDIRVNEEIRAFQQEGRLQSFATTSIRGLLPGGGGEIADAAQSAFDLLDTVPKLGASFDVLKRSIIDNISAIGGAGIGLIGGLTVLALVIADTQRRSELAKQAALEGLSTEEQLRRLRVRGSQEELEQAQELARQRRDDALAQREHAERLKQQIEDALTPGELSQLKIRAAAGTGGNDPLTAQFTALGQTIDEQGDIAERAAIELAGLSQVERDLGFQRRIAAEEAEKLRLEQQAITDERLRNEVQIRASLSATSGASAESARNRLNSLEAERRAIEEVSARGEASAEALEEFQKRLEQIGNEAQIVRSLLPGLEEIERQKQAIEDRQKAEASLFDLSQRAVAIEQQGRAKITQIAEQGIKQVAQAEQKLASARSALVDFNAQQEAKRADIDRQFMDSELERTRKFNKDLERLKEDSNRRLLRLGQELEQSQFEAVLSNDVGAFLRAQREFDRASRDERGSFSTEERRRIDDFNAESQRQKQLLDQKLAALDTEANKRREQLQQRIDEEAAALETTKQQIREKQQAEADAIKKSLRELVQGYDTSTQRMVATTQQGMAIIENAGIDMVGGIVGEMQRQANAFYASQRALIQSGFSGGSTGFSNTGGGGSRIAFQHGTLGVDRPTQAIVGDVPPGMAEAIIPYRKAIGLDRELINRGLGGGGDQHISVDLRGANFGGMNQDEIIRTVSTGVARGLHSARTGQAPHA